MNKFIQEKGDIEGEEGGGFGQERKGCEFKTKQSLKKFDLSCNNSNTFEIIKRNQLKRALKPMDKTSRLVTRYFLK